MLSTAEFERVISAKRLEIQKEKTVLSLSPPLQECINEENDKENIISEEQRINESSQKKVNFAEQILQEQITNITPEDKSDCHELQDHGRIPADLERYIRRYIGLPVMLKTGEYSPNNPLVRTSVPRDGDVFLGLGEYEQRSKTLRKLRQREYREYLDEQARKKQEEKQLAEKKRREQEKSELEIERLQLERESDISLRSKEKADIERDSYNNYYARRVSERDGCIKVDAGVQVNGWERPLSVAVQTDGTEFFHLPSKQESYQTQAERELSPRRVRHYEDRPVLAAQAHSDAQTETEHTSVQLNKSERDKQNPGRKHNYTPSIFDADAIQMRNVKAEQEAAKKRQFYQQDLKNQIQEQQQIREERKAREKLLEQAEMRRMEEQLKMLRAAQEKEVWKQTLINTSLKDNTREFQSKRTALQNEIETIQKPVYRAISQPVQNPSRNIYTSKSDTSHANLPQFHSKTTDSLQARPTFTTNIPDNSLFSENYDVDNYLRKNLNPSKDSLFSHRFDSAFSRTEDRKDSFSTKPSENYERHKTSEDISTRHDNRRWSFAPQIVETAQIHKEPSSPIRGQEKSYEPSFLRKDIKDLIVRDQIDTLPIPVLRHSPKVPINVEEAIQSLNSDAMQKVEDKWKIPAVQKHILKAMPHSGKNGNILTQLGSIRRQLQLEQLKLDQMLDKGSDV